MCNDEKERGKALLGDHPRNDLDNTGTQNSTDKPPS